MPLAPGTRLGRYLILGPLGTGGMGEVYQARDERLQRVVALKVLPAALVADPERLSRFIQEAQLASSLRHPHIITIFDAGSADGHEYVAMELVEGRTLDAVVARTGLRPSSAIRYAIQIADALAAAHAAGIVHRDLKPANIMVSHADQITILDFGVATLTQPPRASPTDETRTSNKIVETMAGTIVGTVAYMSPEQAEGRPVDTRSDIFSFGAILYEMLSGRRAFHADTTTGTLAAVINLDPPPLSSIVADVPLAVERIVHRCLRKDLNRRAQTAADVKVALEEALDDLSSGSTGRTSSTAARRSVPWQVLAVAAVGAAALITAAAMWTARRPPPEPAAPSAFVPVVLTSLPGFERFPSLSPDATQVVFTWFREGAASPDAYVQIIGDHSNSLRLTNDGDAHLFPAWSPDGRWIALWHAPPGTFPGMVTRETAPARLVVISPLGGAERQVIEWVGALRRIGWSPDGRWIAVSPAGTREHLDKGITLVSVETGEQVEWVETDPRYAGAAEPAFSPDGLRVAYVRQRDDLLSDLFVASVGPDGRPTGAPVRVDYGGREARLPVWSADGRQILVVDGSSMSNGGVVRVRADGSRPAERIVGLEHTDSLALSRDGGRLVISRGGGDVDIWQLDLADRTQHRRVASSSLHDDGAVYSPDGTRIAFASNRQGAREIWVADASGENAMPLTKFGGPVPGALRWSPNGQFIAFDGRPDGNADIFVVPAAGGPVRQLTRDPAEQARPAWSHDGREIYFTTTSEGRNEIWRMPAEGGDPVLVTRNGGIWVEPSTDGRWLHYMTASPPYGIHRLHPDGTGDTVILPDLGFPIAAVTDSGVWFTARNAGPTRSTVLRRLGFADGRVRDVTVFDSWPLGLSIARDERRALVTLPDVGGADLLLVDTFR
jgi:serine/threonine protein kinase/Tol biopolymer transport system component